MFHLLNAAKIFNFLFAAIKNHQLLFNNNIFHCHISPISMRQYMYLFSNDNSLVIVAAVPWSQAKSG
jgi:hypothetical protein